MRRNSRECRERKKLKPRSCVADRDWGKQHGASVCFWRRQTRWLAIAKGLVAVGAAVPVLLVLASFACLWLLLFLSSFVRPQTRSLSLSLLLLLLLLLLWLSIPSKNTRRKEGTHEGTNKRQHANGSTQVSQHHSPRLRSIQLHKQSHTFEFISVHLTALHWIALQTHTHTHTHK